MATLRQRMKELLREGEWTALELSRQLSIQEKEVYTHLLHVRKSLRGEILQVVPYRCLSCEYVFGKRERLDRPGRCPRCRQSHITMASFTIT